jgi:ubiquinone/menaquinone biosynthesis C-methylase UbiE
MKQHSHDHNHSPNPQTEGIVIHWAGMYEFMVNRLFGHRSRRMRLAALPLAGIRPGSVILDFGCGAGDLAFETERLIQGQNEIFGIDPSPEMIAAAKKKAVKRKSKAQFQVEAVEKMSFPNNTFDYVISSFVLHHLPYDLQTKAFKELKRVLKPKGLFFAIDMRNSKSLSHRIHARLQGATPDSLDGLNEAAEKLRAAGFREVAVEETASKDVGFVRGVKP